MLALGAETKRNEWCDLNMPWGQTVRVEAVTSAVEPCFTLGLDGWSPGHGPPSWTYWVERGRGGGHLLFTLALLSSPLAHSLITLSSDLLNSGKPCSGWLWSHFVPLEELRMKESEVSQLCPALCDPMDCSPPGPLGLRWLYIRHLIAQVNPEPPYYCLRATKQIAVAHTCGLSLSLGSGMGFCVTLSTVGKWDQEVAASVSHRSWKSPGGWWNIRDDLSAAVLVL